MKLSKVLTALAALLLVNNQFFSYAVYAQEFSISGNGDGSASEISYKAEQNTPIVQSNDAQINNDIEADSTTGENEANNNNGEVQIQTGDATEEVAVLNSGNNSTAQVGCCPDDQPSSASIEDNGSDSENSIDISDNSKNTVIIDNNLELKNNVSVNANTGDNEANNNDGDVFIQTGQINLLAAVLNQNLNTASVNVGNQNKSFNYTISNNGSGSTNSINENNNSNNEYYITNNLALTNNINSSANTGGNKANKNNGKVFISTGNIYLDIILSNRDINVSKIVENCCAKSSPTPTPSPTTSPNPSEPPHGGPSTPPGSSCCSPTTDIPGPGGGGGGGGSSAGSGEVLGASLPATGGSLWFLTALALFMLSFGIILRTDQAYGQTRIKKVFRQFNDSLRAYAFGAYLFANIKVVPAFKT